MNNVTHAAVTLPNRRGLYECPEGFALVGAAGGGTWDRPLAGRPRVDLHPTQEKLRWELVA